MPLFSGSLRVQGETGPGLAVAIDLTDDQHLRIAAGQDNLGDWPLSEVKIRAEDDGFHLWAEGEEVVFQTDNDAAFAVAVGIINAPPMLRRQISALLRMDPDLHPLG